MSTTIQAFVKQFSDTVVDLAEQKASRLAATCSIENVEGEAWTVERLGSVEVSEVLNRLSPTVFTHTPHSRRWGFIRDFDVADALDLRDLLRMKITPQNKYVQKHSSAMGRAKDSVIIEAMGASVKEGKTAGTTTAFDTGNQEIASGSEHLTVEKLIQAHELINAAEVDDSLQRYFIHKQRDLSNLLRDPRLTSSDFNTVRALVNGEIDTYMGFKFIQTELLPDDGTTNTAFAYAWGAIEVGEADAVSTSVDKRPDLRNAWQVYTKGTWGAVRTEDVRIVRVLSTRAYVAPGA